MKRWAFALCVLLMGCQTPQPRPAASEPQFQKLEKQVATNPDAQSALKSINTAFSAEQTVKYCPENGERFSPQMQWCPDHKVKLEWVD